MLSYLTSFFAKHATLIRRGIMVGGILLYSFSIAQGVEASDISKSIIEVLDFLFSIIAVVLGPMVVLSGWLLSPDWTMGDFFGLRPYFREVWILVANITYIIFAIALLYMAIVQIFGGSESEFAFKQKLPRFIGGILLVPFTWMIVSFTLSFANQAVAAVLSIPMGAITKTLDNGQGEQSTSLWHAKVLPREMDFTHTENGGSRPWPCPPDAGGDESKCMSVSSFLAHNQAGPFFIMMIYAYDIFKIQNSHIEELENFCTNTASKNDPDNQAVGSTTYNNAKNCTKSLIDLARKYGLNLVIAVFFAILLLALCWVLLMRAIKLWIYIMFSPLFGLAFFLADKGFGENYNSSGGGGGDHGSMGLASELGIKGFIKLAMVPVLVSGVLAFGLMFVGVVRDNFVGALNGNTYKVNTVTKYCTQDAGFMVRYCILEDTEGDQSAYKSQLIIGTDMTPDGKNADIGKYNIVLNFGNLVTDFIGAKGDGQSGTESLAGAIAGVGGSVTDVFAHLILTIMALAFIWIGVQAAVKYDSVTKWAFSPFEQLGKSVTNFVAHSPSYIPLPHPAFRAMTPGGITQMARMLDQKVINEKTEIGKSLGDILGGSYQDFKSAVEGVKQNTNTLSDVAAGLKNIQGMTPNILKDTRDAIVAAIKLAKPATKNDSEVVKLLEKLEADPSGKNLANILENANKAIEVLEKDDKTKNITQISQKMGATQEAQSHAFHGVTIDGGGNIQLGKNVLIKQEPQGTYTANSLNFTAEQKRHIGSVISQNADINNMSIDAVNEALGKIFPGVTLPLKVNESQRKNILTELKSQRSDSAGH